MAMRDNHRPKQDLIHEVTGLRKQIVDLKEAMVARRRVEDALREAEVTASLAHRWRAGRSLPVPADGTPLTANTPFARMLGLRIARRAAAHRWVLGVFANPEEQSRVLGCRAGPILSGAFFRHKNGSRLCLSAWRLPAASTTQ